MGADKSKPVIYFHVGMGKVASKYLQYDVFPRLKGIRYIPTRLYHRALQIIASQRDEKYLVSREFDQQMEREVKKFAAVQPDTHAIILLRRHDSWIASQYRRFAKNGFYKPFDAFIDIDNDLGRFKKQDLNFMHNIQILEKYFTYKPLVLFYDDLIADPLQFIGRIANFTGTTFNAEDIPLEKKHTSYEEKQIRLMQQVARYLPVKERSYTGNKLLFFFRRLPGLFLRYTILYTAALVPSGMLSNKELIPKASLDRIKLFTENDWLACKQYAADNNKL